MAQTLDLRCALHGRCWFMIGHMGVVLGARLVTTHDHTTSDLRLAPIVVMCCVWVKYIGLVSLEREGSSGRPANHT